MKKILKLLLTIFILTESPVYCQNFGNTWVFGDSVGLSFNSGSPVVLTQPVLSSHESSSSISDSSGNLLFYVGAPTNFGSLQSWIHKVWNQNHQIMPNGDSLMGQTSMTQGSVIIPEVNNPNYYYIFHIGIIPFVGRYLYYSIVDMTANGGTGEVILRNIQLPLLNNNSVIEKMIAIRHGNGRDWWLIVHDYDTTFYSFLISPSGISAPLLQSIGSILGGGQSIGQMQVSPDGTKIVVAGHNALDLYDYNRCSGILSNWVYLGDSLLPTTEYQYYGCSFSPNSQLLYVSNPDTLFQYDLNAANIRNSQLVIYDDTCHLYCHLGQHLLAPDNKIYIANASGYGFGNTIYDAFNMSISYIENPNSLGLSCNFSYLGQYLGGKRSFFGLPNIPVFSMGAMAGSGCDTLTFNFENNSTNPISVFNNGNEIIINSTKSEQLKVELYNTNGQIVFEKEFHKFISFSNPHIPGIYFYKIISRRREDIGRGKLYFMTK